MLGYTHNEGTDAALDALSHPLRRRLLFSLYEQSQDANELPLQRVSGIEFGEENTRITLCHWHLPKLEEQGYVRFDDEYTITKGPEWDQIEPLLRLIYNHLNDLPPSLRGTQSTV